MTGAALELPARSDRLDEPATIEALRASVMQVVTLHTAMFEKLLFQGDDLPLDLAELFEDVGNTYLTFSESISRFHLAKVRC